MKPTFMRWVAIAACWPGTFSAVANPPVAPPVSYGVEEDVFHPVRATQGMVASVDAMATQVGVDILKQGGNAVDAAVAVGYALAVTHPQAGNLGGGDLCCCALKMALPRRSIFVKWRLPALRAICSLTIRVTPMRKVADVASGIRYARTVAGFSLALEKYGTMPLNKVVRPAMKLAEEGFVVNDALANDLKLTAAK